MSPECLPRKVLYPGPTGRIPNGRPKVRWIAYMVRFPERLWIGLSSVGVDKVAL